MPWCPYTLFCLFNSGSLQLWLSPPPGAMHGLEAHPRQMLGNCMAHLISSSWDHCLQRLMSNVLQTTISCSSLPSSFRCKDKSGHCFSNLDGSRSQVHGVIFTLFCSQSGWNTWPPYLLETSVSTSTSCLLLMLIFIGTLMVFLISLLQHSVYSYFGPCYSV